MKYLGIEHQTPRIAVFDFTGCGGCELQLANKEETLVDFLGSVEVVRFREISSQSADDYQVALVEGAVTREDEIRQLEEIRKKSAIVVALGSCACFGGINKLKNAFDLKAANHEVYGFEGKDTLPARAVKEVIAVDMEIPGCPVSKLEVEQIVQHLVLDIPHHFPAYPVCMECKRRYTVCMFLKGQLCLGPITRAGCDAPCPASGLGCWGCRGPAREANCEAFLTAADGFGFPAEEIQERLDMFGGFDGVVGDIRTS